MKVEDSRHSLLDLTNDAKFYKIRWLSPLLLGLVLTVSSRLLDLTKYGLWMDEVFSLRLARLAWNSLFQRAIYDAVHPPLFYILLKLWIMAGGESLLWLKAFPVIFALGATGVLYLFCRSLTITRVEFCLTLILISLNSYLIYYAQELRMYSLLTFLSLLSMWLFVKFLRDDSDSKLSTIILFVVNLLLVYTHYFGWMTVLAECVVVFVYDRSKFKGFLLQTLAVGLCFLPWCVLVVSALIQKGGLVQNLGWIYTPGLLDIPLFLAEFHGKVPIRHATTVGFLIFLPPLLIWLWQIYKDRTRDDSLILALLGLVAAVPILAAWSVSQVFATSVWVDRYLIAAAIPYILLVSVSVSRIKYAAIKRVFLALMICWSLGVGFWNIFQQRTRVNWVGLSNRVSERKSRSGQAEKVFVFEDWAAMPLQQLLGADDTQEPIVHKVESIDEIAEREFWLSYRVTAWKQKETLNEKIQRMNCFIEDELSDEIDNDSVHLILVSCNR